MSEIIALHFCKKCNKITAFMFSGSGSKGECLECGFQSNEDLDWEKDRVVCSNI